MNSETRNCQNCKASFLIDASDFDFYKKIDVPPPTFCPECRLQRRLLALNHQALYKRKCSLCGKDMFSMYPADSIFPVYCPPCWWSDKWNPLDYGSSFDFSKSFFEQFSELQKKTPHFALMGLHQTWINSPYNNLAQEIKNCYLLFNSDFNENCLYGSEIESSKDCVDTTMVESSELIFNSVHITNCHSVFYSLDCENSQNIWFSRDLMNCSDCFGCVNLRNKKYHIFNKPYSKEDYAKELASMKLDSYSGVEGILEKFQSFGLRWPRKFMHGKQNLNASGDYINHSKNVLDSYIALGSQDCRYCLWLLIKGNKDCYDLSQFGENAQLVYESLVCGKNVNNIKFSSFCVNGPTSLQYSENCYGSCSNLFGCAYVHNKKYCILNKQYSKEEYEELVPKIIKHMDEMPYVSQRANSKEHIVYKYGEFFPPALSPFAYNESLAQQYFPLDKNEAEEKGFRWRDPDTKNYVITLKPEEAPDSIKDVDDSILEKIIGCAHGGLCKEQCATAFRITPEELKFYKRKNLPLPRMCFNCRHYQRLAQRNPLKLWQQKCQCSGRTSENGIYNNSAAFHPTHTMEEHCHNEFETSYAPDRPEIIYCEQCYNAEVA